MKIWEWFKGLNRGAQAAIIIGILIIANAGGGDKEEAQKKEAEQPTTTAIVKTVATNPPTTTTTAPKESAKETAYRLAIIKQSSQWGTAFTEFGTLMQNPQFFNDEWTIKVATQIAIMRTLVDEARELKAPDKFTEVHSEYMKGIEDFSWMADNLPKAIDDLDTQAIEKCTEKMQSGTAYIGQATKLINALNQH